MNEFESESLEAELRTLRPADPSQESLERIRLAALPGPVKKPRRAATTRGFRWSLLRLLVPTAAAAAAIALFFLGQRVPKSEQASALPAAISSRPALKANKVEIDRRLLAHFDAVAELPNGEPMRFRCEQWMDKVRVHDTAAGLVLERSTPRLEIVPVRLDTY